MPFSIQFAKIDLIHQPLQFRTPLSLEWGIEWGFLVLEAG